jgi:hypothetical protein
MEFARVLRELLSRRRMLALGALIAAVASVLSVYRLDGFALKSRSLERSGASTQLLVDSSSSVLGNVSQSFEPLASRAAVYANFMTSPVVLDLIGEQVGLSGAQIYAAGPVNPQQPRVVQEPTALKRNVEITGETTPYRLEFESPAAQPTINVFSQAPTTAQAVALANAAVVGLQKYVSSLEASNGVAPKSRVIIRQLGPASGAVVDSGISKTLATMVFVAVFVLWCLLVLVGSRFRESWRASAEELGPEDDGEVSKPAEIISPDDRLWNASELVPRAFPHHASSSQMLDVPPVLDEDRASAPARRRRAASASGTRPAP